MTNWKYIAKRIKYTVICFFAILSLAGCERDMDNEIVSVTPPELHVVTHAGADKAQRIEGATVQVYASAADRTEGKNLVAVAMTNNKGEAVFAKNDFLKGVNYLSVSKNGTTVVAETPYLLQNDGKTLFWVSLN
ncbi:MAG: hypothetical protein LPK09_04595 [Hymenobacteraceae bacterium]|nr:hypothetical protein [Hymenobacteraceae bacterium]